MQSIAVKLGVEGFDVLEVNETFCRAQFVANEMARCEICVSKQDVKGFKLFASGHILIREIIGEEIFWTSVGREVGPKGLFPANSHLAGGWPVEREEKAVVGVAEDLVDWLKENSDLLRLIDVLEKNYFEGDKMPLPTPHTNPAKALLNDLGIKWGSEERYEIVHYEGYAKHLANLHLFLKNKRRCLFFVEKWIDFRGKKNVDPAYPVLLDDLRASSFADDPSL